MKKEVLIKKIKGLGYSYASWPVLYLLFCRNQEGDGHGGHSHTDARTHPEPPLDVSFPGRTARPLGAFWRVCCDTFHPFSQHDEFLMTDTILSFILMNFVPDH